MRSRLSALLEGLLILTLAAPAAVRAAGNETRMKQYRRRLMVTPLPSSDQERKLFQEGLDVMQARQFGTWPAPSSSIASPSGYGAQWTDFFAGVSIQNRPRYRTSVNSTGFVGFGLGNARDLLALEVSIGLHGLVPPGDKGALNLKLHRLLPGDLGVGIGWDNVLAWGGTDGKSSLYFAISKGFQLRSSDRDAFSMLTIHAGLGNGSYRSEEAVFTDRSTLGWFAAAGLRVFAPMTLILNWSGQDLFAGTSFTPFRKLPFAFTLAAQDLTGRAGDGVRYSFSFSYAESLYRVF